MSELPTTAESSDKVHWLSNERAQVYVILAPYLIQLLLAAVCSFVFVILAVALILKPGMELAIVEGLLGPSFFYVIRHYFHGGARKPASKKAKPKM